MRSPVPAISLSSSSHPRPLTTPSCGFTAETSPGIVSASDSDLPRTTTETASSVVLPSVSPGPVLSLTKTYDPDHLGPFSMPDFDFLSDLDRQLQASSPSGAQESSLPVKPAVESSLPVPASKYKPGRMTSRWPEVIVASSGTICHWKKRRAPLSRWKTILPDKYNLQKSALQHQRCQVHPNRFFHFIFFKVWRSDSSVHSPDIHPWGLIHQCPISRVTVTFFWDLRKL